MNMPGLNTFIALSVFILSAIATPILADEMPRLPEQSEHTKDIAGSIEDVIALQKAYWGDCGPLLDAVPEDSISVTMDSKKRRLAIELLERGLCLPFNPELSLRLIEAGHDQKDPRATLLLGWRYWYGYGVDADIEWAKALIDEAMLAFTSYQTRVTKAWTVFLNGRQVPNYVHEWDGWFVRRVDTEEKKVLFAYHLLNGALILPDGRLLGSRPEIASKWFSVLAVKNPEIQYRYGLLQYAGRFGEKEQGKGEATILMAAYCHHPQAVMALAEINLKKGRDGVAGAWESSYTWYRVAEALGVDVESQLRTAKMNLSPLDLYGNDPYLKNMFDLRMEKWPNC
jgi:TPR repeat protein